MRSRKCAFSPAIFPIAHIACSFTLTSSELTARTIGGIAPNDNDLNAAQNQSLKL
jgi:hypothetical protein